MRDGLILQIKGMGIPVQAPTERNQDGYEIRWSSDPEVPDDAPAHVLIGADEVKRFLELGVDRRFIDAKLINLTPVQVEDGCNSMTRAESLVAGINPDNWNTVRIAMVISGKSNRGPVMDEYEWVGTRDEYNQGTHMRETFLHAQHRGITSPAIFPSTNSGHLMRASQFMATFREQYRPSLRATETMARVLEANLVNLDVQALNPDRAKHYLGEIQRAVQNLRDQRLVNLEELGLRDAMSQRSSQDDLDSMPSPRRKPGPTLN